jgi:hypothetical protein
MLQTLSSLQCNSQRPTLHQVRSSAYQAFQSTNGECAKRAKRSTLTMTTFYSVVTFRRCATKKMKKINVLRFLRKKTYCHKCLNISHLELEWISATCSGGDLNPVSGFCFPLFSMVFPRKLPSGKKMADSGGSKIAAKCCKSTYTFCVGYIRSSLKSLAAFLGCS